ncbi:MAG: hypothetical protein ACN6O2_16250 [Stenotrophomonas sp.]
MNTEASPAATLQRVDAPLEFSSAWKQVGPELGVELATFWLQQGAISDPDEARRRADEVVCIGRDPQGDIQAIASVAIKVLPRLLQPMYYFRAFVAPGARGHDHATVMLIKSLKILQSYNAGLPQPESLGILLELENRGLEKRSQRAYIPELNSVFIGYSPRGLHLRVSYFDDAVLLPPVAPDI